MYVCLFQLTRAAQDLLMSVCMNCDQLHSQSDAEVSAILTKIRLKTKSLVSHYQLSMRWWLLLIKTNLAALSV